MGVSDCAREAVEANVEPRTIKKKTRFEVESNGEDEAFLPQEKSEVKQIKTVHIVTSATTETSTGRVSDPCVVTIIDRPHAYGACAQVNGGGGGQTRTRRSIGVSTKDDLAVIENYSANKKSTTDRASDRANEAVSASAASGLKFRLRSKFKPGGRRPSKATREGIDMGKLSNNAANSANKKKSGPLNGILRKGKETGNKTGIISEANTARGASTVSGASASEGGATHVVCANATASNIMPNNNPGTVFYFSKNVSYGFFLNLTRLNGGSIFNPVIWMAGEEFRYVD